MKMKQKFTSILFILYIACISLQAKQIYVAPDGDDTNNGTIENPYWSIQKAQSVASAGDTVYIRGGSYVITESDISKIERDLFACVSFLDKSGTEDNLIKYWAYPGERPVFDFTAVKPANRRVVGIYITGKYIHIKGIEMTGIQVTITTHTESYCIYSKGSYNIFENISMHDNVGTGLRHFDGGYNLFLNCDAYNNHDNVSQDKKGSNSDGFGCHPNSNGKGNVFRGCRAWFNSDDGFDCIRADASIVFDSCWAFYSGYSQSFGSLGDGNGFKIGGFAYDEASKIPSPVPSHTIRFGVAVRNKANGFYSNHHLNGNVWLNNSGYKNSYNFNMVNRESPESDNINVDGYDHVLKNNLGYKGRSGETAYLNASLNTLVTNSFEMNMVLSDDDFVSLDESELMAPRKEDGSLPDINFMKIKPTSNLMNAGTDIGFPYAGDAPEPGALETLAPAVSIKQVDLEQGIIHPNPAKDFLIISDLVVKHAWIIDVAGRQHPTNINENYVDVSQLENGVYILKVFTNNNKYIATNFIINK
jgi:hypothetical protein